ncbi:type VI secretion system contractile sheath domain-containing protein [Tritonibacter litoralis]
MADVLGDLAAAAPQGTSETGDAAQRVLDGLSAAEADVETPEDKTSDVLAELANVTVQEVTDQDAAGEVLDALTAAAPAEEPSATDEAAAVLDQLSATAPEGDASQTDGVADIDLSDLLPEPEQPAEQGDDLDDVLAGLEAAAPAEVESGVEDVLSELAEVPVGDDDPTDTVDAALAGLAGATPDDPVADDIDLSDLLPEAEQPAEQGDDLDDILAGLEPEDVSAPVGDDLGDILETVATPPAPEGGSTDDLDDILGDLADLDDPVPDSDGSAAALASLPTEDVPTEAADPDLGALLGESDGTGDLDDILADLGLEDDPAEADDAAAAAVVDDSADLDLDDLLSDLDPAANSEDGAAPTSEGAASADTEAAVESADPVEIEFPFGTLSADRPTPEVLTRRRFRMAVFGDFSGRAAQGRVEIGDDLAARTGQLLDVDTVEDVIEGFAGDLMLPIGKEGTVVQVPLGGLDDLHPDELYEKMPLFAELESLRKQLASGATAGSAAASLSAWGEKYGTPAAAPRLSSSATAVPADLRLSDFQRLIGDVSPQPSEASPVAELMERVVGPHIRRLPDPNTTAMQEAVGDALSHAMRMVLHHPEFQAIEAQWRTLDLMARSIETNDKLELVLYDISAQELAADLAAEEDLTQSGLMRLLTEGPLDPEEGRGGYSAIIGLYQFEETPPHAELLGRLARVAAHVDAPFMAAISPAFLTTPKEERPKLVAEAWDTLAAMPEAVHLGLLAPRFLLRRPYGAKTDPIYEFDFEEFTEAEGLKGMLWGNPVALAAILMGRSFAKNGAAMDLGSIMSLGDMPYHYVLDRFGDQVALPCTERNIDLDKIATAKERGFMAVSAVKGQDVVRLTSFMALNGGDLSGPWSDIPVPPPSPPEVTAAPEPEAAPAAPAPVEAEADSDSLDDELDALLAGFDDETPDQDAASEDDFDAELAALLDDLR